MITIAIDPGANGGLAWTDGETVHCMKMPETMGDVRDWLQDQKIAGCRVYLEQVGEHVRGNSGHNSVALMGHRRCIEGICLGLHIPLYFVRPQKWMSLFPGRAKGMDSKAVTARKRFVKEAMQREYPTCNITNATADALGILTYALQQDRRAA
jgi:hypothetical protein